MYGGINKDSLEHVQPSHYKFQVPLHSVEIGSLTLTSFTNQPALVFALSTYGNPPQKITLFTINDSQKFKHPNSNNQKFKLATLRPKSIALFQTIESTSNLHRINPANSWHFLPCTTTKKFPSLISQKNSIFPAAV
jgi:hypothetical protein